MKVKNKDVLILIKKIEKYFKVNSYIDFEWIELNHYTLINYKKTPPERTINKKIIIPVDNDRAYCFSIEENSKKIKIYEFLYNENGEGIKYDFEDLEKEVTIPEILNAYQSLLNLKALKIEHF
tara:strand:- start:829 stop:1197 length:369 start_codon:yes stop_codon:yes gene_type:complete